MAPRLLTLAATATALTLLVAAPDAQAAPAAPPAVPGATTVAHATTEAMQSDAAGELLVVDGDLDATGAVHHFSVTTRSPQGTWGAPVAVVSDPTGLLDFAELALASDGTGVLTWARYNTPKRGAETLFAQVRHTDGTWGAPQQLTPGKDVVNDLYAMAVPGHVAVAYDGNNYRLNVATATSAGTSWHTTVAPGDTGFDGQGIALDPQGGLHNLVQAIPRGGDGFLSISRLPDGATKWSKSQYLTTPYLSTDEAQIAIDPQGRELVLYGYVGHNGYRPPGDSEVVGSTAYHLIRQTTPGGRAFRTIWQNPASGSALLSQADGQLRLTFEQWKGHVGRRPRVVQLRTQLLGQPAVILDKAPKGRFWFSAAGGTQLAVSWIKPQVKELYAAGPSGTPVLLDSRADETVWGYWARPGQTAVAGSTSFVGWDTGFVQHDAHGLVTLVDSNASVAPLS